MTIAIIAMFLAYITYREYVTYKERQQLISRIQASSLSEYKKFEEVPKKKSNDRPEKKYEFL